MDSSFVQPRLRDENPYPNDTPKALAERIYVIDDGEWDSLAGMPWVSMSPLSKLMVKIFNLCNLQGYALARWDSIKLRLTLNSTAFCKGMMMLAYRPGKVSRQYQHSAAALYQCPNVCIDASTTTVVEMDIPFYYPKQWYSIGDDLSLFGMLYALVLDPLVNDVDQATGISIPYTIEACFNNFELASQTIGSTAPAVIANNNTVLYASSQWNQVQGPGRNSPASEAVRKSKAGVISGPAEAVGQVAHALKNVPVVGEIAGAVEFGAGIVKSVAQWFGFSKPNSVHEQFSVRMSVFEDQAYLRGLHYAAALATVPDPYVASDAELVRTTFDETDLVHIQCKPSIWAKFQVAAAAAIYSLIGTIPVTPCQWNSSDGGIFATNLGYVSSFFKLWRGDLTYKFVFPATALRRYRVAISWSPKKLLAYDANVRQIIVSVSGSTSVDVTVPWLQPTPYLPNSIPKASADNLGSANGFLQLWLLAPLTSNSTTSPTYSSIIVFSAGTQNTQFACFKPPINDVTRMRVGSATPFALKTDPNMITDADLIRDRIAGQEAMGEPLSAATSSNRLNFKLTQGSLGANSSQKMSGLIAEDDILSLREIAHRDTSNSSFTTASATVPRQLIRPAVFVGDLLDYVKTKFLFSRHSYQYKIMLGTTTPATGQEFFVYRGGINDGGVEQASYWVQQAVRSNCSFLVPFSCIEACSWSTQYDPNVHNSLDLNTNFTVQNFGSTSASYRVSRSAGDDLSLGCCLVSPLLTISP